MLRLKQEHPMTNASDAQLTRLEATLTDNGLYGDHWDRLWKILEAARLHERDASDGAPLSPSRATEIITWLTGKGYTPKRTQQAPAERAARKPYPRIPAGRYATDSRTGNNSTDFWLIEVPTEGKWAGYSFVRRVIGGRPETDIRGPEARAALEAIEAAGPEAARDRYSDELDQCWKCNSHLTDDLSRLTHIGPDCCKIVYGVTQAQRAAALGLTLAR
jgi:Family of unknown function (DUF6011)